MKARLDNIDETMSHFKTAIKDMTKESPPSDPTPFSTPVVELNEPGGSRVLDARNFLPSPNSRCHIVNKQYYGSSSLLSLLREIQSLLQNYMRDDQDRRINTSVMSQDESLEEFLTITQNLANSMTTNSSMDLSNDGLSLVLPHKGLLDAFIEPYFSQINWMLPVFRKDVFCDNVRKIYAGDPRQADSAWIVCFNIIILQTLNARALDLSRKFGSRAGNSIGDAMEAELARSFILNARPGLDKLERFLEPRLVNVQALISMVCNVLTPLFPHLQTLCHYESNLLLYRYSFDH